MASITTTTYTVKTTTVQQPAHGQLMLVNAPGLLGQHAAVSHIGQSAVGAPARVPVKSRKPVTAVVLSGAAAASTVQVVSVQKPKMSTPLPAHVSFSGGAHVKVKGLHKSHH